VAVDEPDAFGDDELLDVLVEYHRSPLGAWTATLVPDGLEPVTLQATSAYNAFHQTMELIEALSEHADLGISIMHTVDGDPWSGPRSSSARVSLTASSPAPPAAAPPPS
jgi:hypothetical protein